ncbi:MAG: hypothetical protein AAGC96_04940 [Pseudomonadota bacterium]
MTKFRGRQRKVMAPNRYTELFFLDEVTALAAGHRPCFECRRADAKKYAAAFPEGPLPADDMDHVLHRERCVSGGPRPVLGRSEAESLPAGSMFANGNACFAVGPKDLLRWQYSGYTPVDRSEAVTLLRHGGLKLLTPRSTVEALKGGFTPLFHPSAIS